MGSPHEATRHPSFTGFRVGQLCMQRLDLAGRLHNWLHSSIEGHSHYRHAVTHASIFAQMLGGVRSRSQQLLGSEAASQQMLSLISESSELKNSFLQRKRRCVTVRRWG